MPLRRIENHFHNVHIPPRPTLISTIHQVCLELIRSKRVNAVHTGALQLVIWETAVLLYVSGSVSSCLDDNNRPSSVA